MIHISSVIKRSLLTPHDATGLPPFYWITVDKATIHRRTSQCILIVAVWKGKKEVFPVGTPLVYKGSEVEDLGDEEEEVELLGGKSEDLVDDILKNTLARLSINREDLNYLTGE